MVEANGFKNSSLTPESNFASFEASQKRLIPAGRSIGQEKNLEENTGWVCTCVTFSIEVEIISQ